MKSENEESTFIIDVKNGEINVLLVHSISFRTFFLIFFYFFLIMLDISSEVNQKFRTVFPDSESSTEI